MEGGRGICGRGRMPCAVDSSTKEMARSKQQLHEYWCWREQEQTREVRDGLLRLVVSAARANASDEERREALRILLEALENGWLLLSAPSER